MKLLNLLPGAWKERLKTRAGVITLENRLRVLRRAGFRPKEVIDAGAYRGDWTRVARRVFPEARFLLIEPQASCLEALQAMMLSGNQVQLCQTLLGKERGEVRFLIEGTNSRVLAEGMNPELGAKVEVCRVTSLSEVAKNANFERPDFIKLDLQGHELEALGGAGDLFGTCELFMVEVSWLRIGPVPLVHEVIHAFVDRGYRPYDISGHTYRPRDGALWQSDMMFVRADSALIASRDWA